MAITDMDAMVKFYESVFDVRFAAHEMYGATLYQGGWIGLNLLFCPREIAQNTAEQNRHQFDIIVDDLDAVIEMVNSSGGEMMGEIAIQSDQKVASIKDPDGNSIVLKQQL